ncbi:hypothetical protein, partial [Cupriavidus consociatus]|uniref:hypothetical protein n=1 Tax=Cupriavidus consociatus TaxID=2821357 RepID=UPI001AE88819
RATSLSYRPQGSNSIGATSILPRGASGRVLEITTTTDCIVGCSYCPQAKFATKQKTVSQVKHLCLGDFKQCLACAPKSVDISFAGYAEPWLNPACTEMVEHAYMRGYGIRIFTTLIGMDKFDLKRLQALRFRVFVVHVLTTACI